MPPDPSPSSPSLPRRGLIAVGSLALVVSCAGPALAVGEEGPEGFASQPLAIAGEGGHATYREPSIVQLEDGDLLASYIGGGSTERAGTALLQRRSTDGGATWGEQTLISEGAMSGSGPSTVLDAETGTLFVFHTRSLGAVLAVSEDGGRTWTNRSLRTVIDRGTVSEMRATGGAGIQIRSGQHAGRLVQAMTGRWPDGSVRAFALVSDDHGAHWRMGEPLEAVDLEPQDPQMGESTVLELEGGRLLLQSGGTEEWSRRSEAISDDGGITWGTPELRWNQRDQGADGSAIAMDPDAPPGSEASRELLLSHSRTSSDGIQGPGLTLRYSCNGGEDWPGYLDLRSSLSSDPPTASRLIALQDGTYGLLHEEDGSTVSYTAFDREALDPHCVTIESPDVQASGPGTFSVEVTIRNDGDEALEPGTVWSDVTETVLPVDMPRLEPGESFTCELWVDADFAGPKTLRGAIIVSTGDDVVLGETIVHLERA